MTHDGDNVRHRYRPSERTENSDGPYKSKPTDVWFSYGPNGRLETKITYKEDPSTFSNSYWIIYHENGQEKSKGTFKVSRYNTSRKDGLWEYFYEDGTLERTETYKDGKKNGLWEYFYLGGSRIKKEIYENDKLIKTISD